MPANEIAVKLVLDENLAAQFKRANETANVETKKLAENTTSMAKQVKANYLEMTGNAKEFGMNLMSGNVAGAVQSFARTSVSAFKAFGLEMAIATGGITLLIGGLVMLSKHIEDDAAKYDEMVAKSKKALEDYNALVLDSRKSNSIAMEEEYNKNLKTIEDYYNAQSEMIGKANLTASEHRQQRIQLNNDVEQKRTEALKKYQDATKEAARTQIANEKKTTDESIKIADDALQKRLALKAIEVSGNMPGDKNFKDANDKAIQAAAQQEQALYSVKEEAQQAANELFKRNAEERRKIRAKEKEDAINLAKAQNAAGADSLRQTVDNLAYLSSQVNEFKGLYKAAAITQTSVDTYVGAQGIFKNIATAPYLGPFALPMATAGAAIAIAAGLARVAEISKFAAGGDFTTNGPRLIMVGDNPGGRERVSVTPLSSPNINGPSNSLGNIDMSIHVSGNADSTTVRAINDTRERQLKRLRRMLQDLGYARQMPSFA
jgi:hypothetical protein